MATIPKNTVLGVHDLTGADVKLLLSISTFCTAWLPWTDEPLKSFYELIRMDNTQASKAYKNLESKKFIGKASGRTYLLKLDGWQFDTAPDGIAIKFPNQMRILADLGCETALERVKRLEKLQAENQTNDFLMQFFLSSILANSQPKLAYCQPPVDYLPTDVGNMPTPYKDSYGDVNTNGNGRKKEASSASAQNSPGSSDEAGPGEKRTGELSKAFDEELREDIKLDDKWRKWLATKPAYKPINIEDLWDLMTEWCRKKRAVASRRRFLNWLHKEVESIPVDITITEEKPNGNGQHRRGHIPAAKPTAASIIANRPYRRPK